MAYKRKTKKSTSLSPAEELQACFDKLKELLTDKYEISKERKFVLSNIKNAEAWSTHLTLPAEKETVEEDPIVLEETIVDVAEVVVEEETTDED